MFFLACAVQNQTAQFVGPWIQQHSADAKSPLEKPAIIKEYGSQVGGRCCTFAQPVYTVTRSALPVPYALGHVLCGPSLWAACLPLPPAAHRPADAWVC